MHLEIQQIILKKLEQRNCQKVIHPFYSHLLIVKYIYFQTTSTFLNFSFMTDTDCKKVIMKMLGIQQLISEYENRCDKFSARKKNNNPKQIRNRYASLLDFDNNKQENRDAPRNCNNSSAVLDNKYAKTSNKSYQTLTKQPSIHSQINTAKNSKEQTHIIEMKDKIMCSMENLSRNTSLMLRPEIKNKISVQSKQPISPSVNEFSNILSKPNPKESNRYSSYLSLKARNTQKSKNQQVKVEIDLENPTLAGVNKKIKDFENKLVKKDEKSTVFKKHLKNKQSEHLIVKKDQQNPKVLSETISFDRIKQKQKQQFISIDTNYYGFSFKNKIPFKPCKNSLHQDSCIDISSTLDKSNQNQEGVGMKIVSKSTSKIHPSSGRKTYSTLNNNKKDRYNSTNLLKNKKAHSSLILKPKSILKDRYQIIKVIGRGMSGQVFQAKDVLSDRFVAIKQIDENGIEYEFFREISHQNVISYYNNFLQKGKRYLVLEYFPMTLRDLLKDSKKQIDITENNVKHIFKSIINGLSYLHSLNIAHRDIKLDNIVISQDLSQVKFIDFGLCIDLSKIQDGGLSKQFCGTLSYLSPEIIEGQPHEPKKADIWSLGIVLYAISFGRLPYKGKNESEILAKISKGRPVYPEGFNPKLKQLIECMLEKNPAKRWTVSRILSHEWLQ